MHHLNTEASKKRGTGDGGYWRGYAAQEPIAVHRLDQGTSGVLLLAKDKISSNVLQSAFEVGPGTY